MADLTGGLHPPSKGYMSVRCYPSEQEVLRTLVDQFFSPIPRADTSICDVMPRPDTVRILSPFYLQQYSSATSLCSKKCKEPIAAWQLLNEQLQSLPDPQFHCRPAILTTCQHTIRGGTAVRTKDLEPGFNFPSRFAAILTINSNKSKPFAWAFTQGSLNSDPALELTGIVSCSPSLEGSDPRTRLQTRCQGARAISESTTDSKTSPRFAVSLKFEYGSPPERVNERWQLPAEPVL
ncbi:hypothetical protein HGM15179_007649 [Zosterops borbonicus]|uniref:Uncharacterized protein n=1 Tax=Zosterops borbonicus TaxID=364589 RepID=A0A8K1GIC0_9PASS|nr:hypothetical protein HGM15179_007649 [Zosterops borbonicus]